MKLPIQSKNDTLHLMKKILILLSAALVCALASYFTRWESSSVAPLEAKSELVFPEKINRILDKSCNDCHTPYTKIPLYGHIFPITLYLQDHVEEAQTELNFVKWNEFTRKRKLRKTEEIIEQIDNGEMPPKSYLLLHPDSKLSTEDISELKNWSEKILNEDE
jgi:hypothetical protein